MGGLASSCDVGSFGGAGSCDADAIRMGPRKYFTCTVGRKPTAAQHYLNDVDEVSELLANLSKQHAKVQQELPVSYNTWSSGLGKASRLGSMPSLSTVQFGATETGKPRSQLGQLGEHRRSSK